MQSEKQKKHTTFFIIVGGIVLVALLIAIIWAAEGAKAGTGQAVYILEKMGMESPQDLRRFLIQTGAVAVVMLLVFLILVHQYRKNTRILLEQEKADKDRLRAALAQI
ncbi:MAG: hypothetical protein K2G19_12890, partial [Lachnospiraceae bacterium]|nr:hypothetical protein [Lachnospiraceae bacterium]